MSGGPFLTGTFVSNCGGGHGVCVFAESVFIVRPEIGMTEKLSKLGSRGLQGFSSEGGIIKLSMKGWSSWVVLSFVIKNEQFSWGKGEFFNLQFGGSGCCGNVSLLLGSWWYHRRLCLFVLPGIALSLIAHVWNLILVHSLPRIVAPANMPLRRRGLLLVVVPALDSVSCCLRCCPFSIWCSPLPLVWPDVFRFV